MRLTSCSAELPDPFVEARLVFSGSMAKNPHNLLMEQRPRTRCGPRRLNQEPWRCWL
jgi:hypothetical protein